ncbi:MAG TPA: alanine racemase [Patescibacteria group bacterium]
MLSFLHRPTYRHLNKIMVNSRALKSNFEALQKSHPEAKIAPVLKSNAYGHGLLQVARVADDFGAPFIAVDSLYEAYELYKERLKTPILILGYTHPDNYKVKKLPFHFAVFDLETMETLDRYQPGAQVHLFVDTGMSREGILVSELPTFLKKIKSLESINIVGLATHLADADNPQDQSFTLGQIEKYKTALQIVRDSGLNPEWKHISASGGTFKYHDPTFNLIRAGIALYGINPLASSDAHHGAIKLQPALRFETTLAQIKQISRGSKVGYNGTHTAKNDMKIGILPIGYYDGVDRRLSNKGWVQIGDVFCPIIGRVSMNITVVDLTPAPDAKVGERVVIFSDQPGDKNSLVNSAATAGTIPYELMVKLAESVRREVEPL